jgi:hypothetical protein
MSKRSDALLSDMLGNRWQITHAPAAGAAISASVAAPRDGHGRHVMDCLSFTVKNMAAAIHTVTTSVRDATSTGTVLASWDVLVPVGTTKEIVLDGLGIQATKGAGLYITQDTVLASVKATVNASGWTDSQSDY